jgi:hypothetical protein
LRDVLDFQHKLWDQLLLCLILSCRSILLSYSFKRSIAVETGCLNYPQNFPKYNYGNNIKYMIDVANKWDDYEMKNALVKVIANHMKKSYLSWNKDTVRTT